MISHFGLLALCIYIFIHGLRGARAQTICSNDDSPMIWNNIAEKDIESWHLCSDKPPKVEKFWPSVGNGHVGTVVHSDAVYMNGLYSGNGTQSTRARIPALTSLDVSEINLPHSQKTYCLQMENGIYVETYTGNHWNMELKIYAHRTVSRLLVTELTVKANGNHPRLSVSVNVNKGNKSKEIDFISEPSGLKDTKYMHGSTKIAETPQSGRTPVFVYYSSVPNAIVIEAGKTASVKHTFLMSVGPDKEEARSYYKQGIAMQSNNTLESTHKAAWHAVWDAGRVDIYGSPYLSALTYSSLYYIISAMPTVEEKTWPFVGLSPADLAHNGYNGHIFWDQDTWMFTPILVINSDLGKTIVNTRIRVLDSAKEYAKQTSYEGARFPWEGALSGFDVTPWFSGELEDHVTGDVAQAFQQYIMVTHDTHILQYGNMSDAIFAIADFWLSRSVYDDTHDVYNILGFDVTPSKACGKYEVHISGDVALAFQQYILMTNDVQILKEGRLKEAIFELADYWISRTVNITSLGTIEIEDVMPPDEYHFPVNNSVYTNYIAQKSLRLPAYVCELTGCQVPSRYEEVASKIKIQFDDTLQYHPEYDGYNTSINVKQADAILLGWPLEMNMSEQIRRNDLEIYEKVTPGGPAMSWGMFTVGWIEIGEYDKANKTFYEQLKNRRDPFNIWTENADGTGTTNFITGMGGYLHSLIFGYAGVRFSKDNLTVNCSPFPDTSSYRLKDIDYVGNSVDIICDQDSTKLTQIRGSDSLLVTLSASGKTFKLEVGKPVCVERQKLTITAIPKTPTSNNPTKATTASVTVKDAACPLCTSFLWTCFLSIVTALLQVLI